MDRLPTPKTKQEENVNKLVVKTAEHLGCSGVLASEDVVANIGYVGEGEGLPGADSIEEIQMVSELESSLLAGSI